MAKREQVQRSEPPGYTEIWLRCPICRGISKVYWRGLDDFPYVKCQSCGEISASRAYKVVAMDYEPEPAPRHYSCQYCGELDCEKDHVTEEVPALAPQAV